MSKKKNKCIPTGSFYGLYAMYLFALLISERKAYADKTIIFCCTPSSCEGIES